MESFLERASGGRSVPTLSLLPSSSPLCTLWSTTLHQAQSVRGTENDSMMMADTCWSQLMPEPGHALAHVTL